MKREHEGQQRLACRRGAREGGAVLVEFALVLPLLLLVLLGTVEFGRAINYWIDETHLANVAARWAAVDKNPGPEASLQESVLSEADTNQLREGAKVCISFPGSAEVGEPVEAQVTSEFTWMPFIGNAIGVTTTTLTGSATMRIERAPSHYTSGC